MATWKKIIVSGSNVSQLANDAGYLTSVTAQTAYVTASVGGTHLIANDSQGNLNFATGSTQITLSANAGTDTLTFGLGNGVVSGSAQINGANIISGSISGVTLGGSLANLTVDNSSIQLNTGTTYNGSAARTISIKADGITNTMLANMTRGTIKVGGTSNAPTDLDAKTSGQILIGDGTDIASVAISGDVTLAANGAVAVTKVQGVALTSGEATQLATIGSTTISATQWGYLGGMDQDVKTNSNVNFANGIFSGDLTVNGTTTTVNTDNLNIADKFILINSGSSTATDESGIIFGGSNGTAGNGAAVVWNGDYNSNDGRLAIANSVNATATTAAISYYVGGVFDGSSADAATAKADHRGNIRVDSSNDIYIYV
tara:strand:- start:261 stop:1379 length:1119 start_codon:yes stop_codon:yes gene_type:complete